MIEMNMGLFAATLLVFFLGGGAVGWLLRELRCKCDDCCCEDGTDNLTDAIRDAMRKDPCCD